MQEWLHQGWGRSCKSSVEKRTKGTRNWFNYQKAVDKSYGCKVGFLLSITLIEHICLIVSPGLKFISYIKTKQPPHSPPTLLSPPALSPSP